MEERVIPFDLTVDDNVGFDAEDTWQAVARWGTANTPQDIPGAYDYDDAYINADEDISTVTPLEGIEAMVSWPLTGSGFIPGLEKRPVMISWRSCSLFWLPLCANMGGE